MSWRSTLVVCVIGVHATLGHALPPKAGPGARAPVVAKSALRHQARGDHTAARPRAAAPRPLKQAAATALAGVSLLLSLNAPVQALDSISVGECILQNCAPQLARCIADPACAANVVCLNLCNGKKDETACEIRCGDQFENKVVEDFNSCAVSNKKCVPQTKDNGAYPIPPPGATVDSFNLADFTGTWYITAGQNQLFDTFPCQKHEFSNPAPGKLIADLQWRVKTSYGAELQRGTEQSFVQDSQKPGILYNHDNEFLHYQDDWYILAAVPDEYFLVYYRGTNDAWDGYGGAVLYTREKTLPEFLVPELRDACAKVPGLSWDDFKKTDNSCRRLAKNQLSDELEKDAAILRLDFEELENDVEVGLFGIPKEIEKDFSAIEKEVEKDYEEFGKDLNVVEKMLFKGIGTVFGGAAGK